MKNVTPEHLRCAASASCSSVNVMDDGQLLIVGDESSGDISAEAPGGQKLALGSIPVGWDERAVIIPQEYFSNLPEMVQLREENAGLRKIISGTWESADTIDEGEHLFVWVTDDPNQPARYGVGIKAWQDPEDAAKYVVGNWPWAGRPTHAMPLPKPPSGQTTDEYLAPSKALLRAAINKATRNEITELESIVADLINAVRILKAADITPAQRGVADEAVERAFKLHTQWRSRPSK